MQAPKGGVTIAGVFYKGGQFLPADYEPKRGLYNRSSAKKVAKPRKIEIAPYQYAEAVEGKRSIYRWVAGTVASTNRQTGKLELTNKNALAYVGLTEEKANELINMWNNGERWV